MAGPAEMKAQLGTLFELPHWATKRQWATGWHEHAQWRPGWRTGPLCPCGGLSSPAARLYACLSGSSLKVGLRTWPPRPTQGSCYGGVLDSVFCKG